MAPEEQADSGAGNSQRISRMHWVLRPLVFIIVLALGFYLLLYLPRRELADDLIRRQLAAQGLQGSYEIAEIGTSDQLLRDIVIGDPNRPDVTIDRLVVRIAPRFGLPAVERISVSGVRLFGTYRDGQLSFGSLDPVIFTDGSSTSGLPSIALEAVDTRVLLDTEFGKIAASATGNGNLSDGFTGHLAAIGQRLSSGNCALERVTFYTAIRVQVGKPMLDGPLRIDGARCADGLSLADIDLRLQLGSDKTLSVWTGSANGRGETLISSYGRADTVTMNSDFSWSEDGLESRARLGAGNFAFQDIFAKGIGVQATVTANASFSTVDARGDISVLGAAPGSLGQSTLASLSETLAQTPVGPVLKQFAPRLRRDLKGASLEGQFSYSQTPNSQQLALDRIRVRNASGGPLLLADRLEFGSKQPMAARVNVVGRGWPPLDIRLTGNMSEQQADIQMRAWAVDNASIAVPAMRVTRRADGAVSFAGRIAASGPIPAGQISSLNLPVDGGWSPSGGLFVWRQCVPLSFARLQLAAFDLARGAARLCPDRARAVVRNAADGLHVGARTGPLELEGQVGSSPARLEVSSLKISWPGGLSIQAPRVVIGEGSSATRIASSTLVAGFDGGPHGSFEGLEATIGEVPLALSEGAGDWRYADALEVRTRALTISDRALPARFVPLYGPDMTLSLLGNDIAASGRMLTRRAGRAALDVMIEHDLGNGTGAAEFTVPDLLFDKQLQPDEVTPLALGVVANVDGVVSGVGKIDWSSEGVTSSVGSFSTTDMNLAAAFGPVSGLTGNIDFVDLLNLETAPGQTVAMQEVNPGIPVNDGVLTYRLLPDLRMEIAAGRWPFAGGILVLESTRLSLSDESARNLTFRIEGMDSAILLQKLEFENLNATGVFDGRLPIIFDQDGGRIEGGRLDSREPGGTVAYVGELSYKNLGTIANFAFGALKSLRYRQMGIDLDGSLDGEIVTSVKFSGIEQGEGAESNFLTRKVAKLPLVFNINVRAPFYQLITSTRSLYDPGYIRDPSDLGLLPGGPAVPGEGEGEPEQ